MVDGCCGEGREGDGGRVASWVSIWRARSCGYRADLGFTRGRSMFTKLGIGLLCRIDLSVVFLRR